MTADPDDRDILRPPLCSECTFRIIDEPPILGRYGWCHSACLDGAA